MSATKARKLLPYEDFTHYLSIPIITRSSRPQLQASFARFERETSAIIPKGSVKDVDIVRLDLGRLKLQSEERIHACSQHLGGLDLHEMLRVAAVNAMAGQPNPTDLPYIGDAAHAVGVATAIDFSPLKVDVSGLFSMYDDPSRTRALRALVIDRTHRLQHIQHLLLNSLFKADFLANAFHSTILVVDTAVPLHWGYKGTYDRNTGRWSASGRPVAPKIDARDLIRRWKDYEWATDIQLALGKVLVFESVWKILARLLTFELLHFVCTWQVWRKW